MNHEVLNARLIEEADRIKEELDRQATARRAIEDYQARAERIDGRVLAALQALAESGDPEQVIPLEGAPNNAVGYTHIGAKLQRKGRLSDRERENEISYMATGSDIAPDTYLDSLAVRGDPQWEIDYIREHIDRGDWVTAWQHLQATGGPRRQAEFAEDLTKIEEELRRRGLFDD